MPRHQATAQLAASFARDTFALQTRWSGRQFDDDLNQFALRSYFLADAFVSHPLTSAVAITVAAENILNRGVEVSATPVITLGSPRAVRVGVRYRR